MAKATAASKKKASVGSDLAIVGIDVGFGITKVVSNYTEIVEMFPSAVHPGKISSSKLSGSTEVNKNNLIVKTEDGTFFVGKQAMETPGGANKRTVIRDRASDQSSRVLFQTGIALGVPHEEGEYNVFVVTGVPNKDYDLTIRERLLEFLSQGFEVTFALNDNKTITKKINIVGVEVLRQPEGTVTYNQFEFSPESFITATDDARNMIGAIDFGHFTTDFALFREGVIIENDGMNDSTDGVTSVYNLLKKKLTVKFDQLGYDYTASEADLDAAVKYKEVTYVGKSIDVSEEVERSARTVAGQIAKTVLDAWGNETNRLEKIIISGGGSELFGEFLREEFEARNKQLFDVVNFPQESNALGFYMYAIMLQLEELGVEELFENYINPVFEDQTPEEDE